MSDLKCAQDMTQEEFNCWLIPIEKVSKLTGHVPKEIYFAKAEGKLLKLNYPIPLEKPSWYSLKEKMHA